jgi:membrane carboxypeptidase/penicillin-binding protein
LGALDTTPLEVSAAFTPIADNGFFSKPYAIQRVLDHSGSVIYQANRQPQRVATPSQVYMVRDILRGVLEEGTARSARSLGYPFVAAGKTGTTNDLKDAWFVGFDSELLTVVWVGSDHSEPIGFSGARAALPIWVNTMKAIRGNVPPVEDSMPGGITSTTICEESLEKAAEDCPNQRKEIFWAGNEPARLCHIHGTRQEHIENAMGRLKERFKTLFNHNND